MCRGGVRRPPDFLDVLAVVALRVGQPEEPLLEPVVVAVPECDAEVEEAEAVADRRHTVLAPAVGTSVRLVERQVVPSVSVRGVVLADGPPLAAGDVRTPQPPGVVGVRGRRQAGVFGALFRTHPPDAARWN